MISSPVVQKETSLFANRNYRLLWTGQALSLTGDYFLMATIAIWVIDKLARGESWLPLISGAIAFSAAMPSLLLSPFAGVWVDRWEKRTTMLWTDGVRTALVALFLSLTLVASQSTMLLISCLTILALVACGQQFFLPARIALVADLVPENQHIQAYGSIQQANYLAQIVGPSLAAPLYIALGPMWAILLDVLSFLVSLILLFLLHVPVQGQPKSQPLGFWHEWLHGLRFFVQNRVLVTLLISGMLFSVGGMAYNSFEYLYGTENLHITATLLGLYVGCFGMGVVLGLPLMAALAKRMGEVEILWIGLIGYGLTTLALSRMTTMVPGMMCGLLLGFFNTSVFVAVRPLTMLATPRQFIGRVLAFEKPLITVASLLGGALASTLASTLLSHFHTTVAGMTFGPLDTIFVGAGIVIVGAGVFTRLTLYRAVKQLRATSILKKQQILQENALSS